MNLYINFSAVTACGECCTGCRKRSEGVCDGCIESDGYVSEWHDSGRCPIHACARKQGVQFCGLCAQFPCSRLPELIPWNPRIIEHLSELARSYREQQESQHSNAPILEPMDVFFENRLSDYDEHMLTAIEGAEEFYPYTASLLPMNAGCEVLDLGCGTGLELGEYFSLNPHARVTGIDLSSGMLDALRAKFPDRDIRLIHGSYFDVPLGEEFFDAAVSVESLHHFTAGDKLSLYRKLHRALKPGSYFVLTDYFAESEALEQEYFENLRLLREEQDIPEGELYHYDTPLTVEHETDILLRAGFSRVETMNRWEATFTLRAKK